MAPPVHALIMIVRSFVNAIPGDDLIKRFWSKYTHPHCKLEHFRAVE